MSPSETVTDLGEQDNMHVSAVCRSYMLMRVPGSLTGVSQPGAVSCTLT